MHPSLKDGQIVIVKRKIKKLRIGDIVMITNNGHELIKRIADISSGEVYVLGDNIMSSTDSRNFGWIKLSDVVGVV